MSCTNKVETWHVGSTSVSMHMLTCGQTGFHGKVVQCEECEAKERERYPQGWRHVPGDTCKHGVYTGDAYGPDYMCGHCENGDD